MKWLRPLFRRSAVEREMDAELRFHYQRLVEDFLRQGMAPPEARRRARLEFGGLEQIKDDARESRRAEIADRFARWLRSAARTLAKSPGFTVVAVVTLALGIGANTVIFSILDQAILRSMPVKDPQRLVVFRSKGVNPGMDRSSERKLSFSYPKYLDFRDRCTVFQGVAARFAADGSLLENGSTERVDVDLVSGNFFALLGVRAAAGRLIAPTDDRTPMGHPVAVLSDSYWRQRFGGDPSIAGRQVTMNGLRMTVIGVSAVGFNGVERGANVDVWVPMMMKDLFTPDWAGGFDRRDWAWLNIIARLRPKTSLRQAEEGANLFYRQVLQDEAGKLTQGAWAAQRDEFLKRRLDLLPGGGGIMAGVDAARSFLVELMAMAGIVLLIACVNLAGLLMARTAARQRELAIRLALGAGRMGVARQLLGENLLLALAGGAAGVLVAAAVERPVLRFLVDGDSVNFFSDAPDLRVLAFSLLATTFTAAILALAPVFQIRRTQLAGVLRTETGASPSRSQVRFRKALVAVQLSFCVWLMIAAGLFARSLARLKAVDLGFRKENLISFGMNPRMGGMNASASLQACQRVKNALAATPGVAAVAWSDYGVMTGGIDISRLDIDGYQPASPTDTEVYELLVTPGYLSALGLQLQAGRDFTDADLPRGDVVLVNETFARHYCQGRSPVGLRVRNALHKKMEFGIVGMVRDQKYFSPRQTVEPMIYKPVPYAGDVTYYVRTGQAPAGLTATIRKVVEQQAPGVPVYRMQTMTESVDLRLGTDRQMSGLASFFGLLATVLAAIGLYGVMAYTVARRTREIGIRMALGAARRDVLRMVVGEAGVLIAIGLAIGLPSGLALAQLVRSQLFGVTPLDPVAVAGAALVVTAVALVSGYLPARRATAVDPVRALRWE